MLRARTSALVPALLVALVVTLAGCGSSEDDGAQTEQPSKAAVACRQQWRSLEQKVEGRDSLTNPSALAARWNSISATIGYYRTSASAEDCGTTLAAQEKAMESLKAFSARLAPYDMELGLEDVKDDAEAYAAGPRPKASPAPTGKKGSRKKKAAPRPPRPADVAAALKTLTRQAPRATRQQGPGWEQAKVAELGEAAAVRKTVKDLRFLSGESSAYRASRAALAEIRKALAATTG